MIKTTCAAVKEVCSLHFGFIYLSVFLFSNFIFISAVQGQVAELLVPDTVYLHAYEFEYGSTNGDSDEQPLVRVQLDSFYISRFETTVAQFSQFVQDTNRSMPAQNNSDNPDYPVVNVTIEEAKNYARWLSRKTGEKWRLPNEFEWEFAAGLGLHKEYVGGIDAASLCKFGNIADESAVADMPNITPCNDGSAGLAEVGSYAPNNASLYDMHGNVWEWTSNCYRDTNGAYKPFSCDAYSVRGGSYLTPAIHARVTNREQLDKNDRLAQVGFRLVKER